MPKKKLLIFSLITLGILSVQPTASATVSNDYSVKAGDTLDSIAAAHETTLRDILTVNPGLKESSLLHVGQVIYVPDVIADDAALNVVQTAQATIGVTSYTDREFVSSVFKENGIRLYAYSFEPLMAKAMRFLGSPLY
ncbi:LysM peptidoglycan-binding domain-containing protein [Aneurinibacillus terranovensis]|uniref:LysM peptidoglycan-binding domain-containing protein n=1 Tax=Aneurinibacillus terranovensis TaxID=278991 RepID=UPI000426995A|nr:LysM domain-containing protein [Aneurinibacillus terranovensis]